VTGLVARADLNGSSGTLVELVESEGRWKVIMDDGSKKMFHLAHLDPLASMPETGAEAPSANLAFAPGARAAASAADAIAAVAADDLSALDDEAGPFSPGSRVEVRGLTMRPDLNG
ncbi:unnamed protein product, partial [Polarella glacialis]